MFLFPFFTLFVFFIFYRIKKTSSKERQNAKSFLEYEQNANFVRKKDISGLDYIKVPLEELPFKATSDPMLSELQENVKAIAGTDILNLTGITNTELKYSYGLANLDKLTICDNNFIKLSRALYNWGMYLYKNQMTDEAVSVMEYAVSCRVDISGIYTTLASIYSEQKQFDKIDLLKEQAASLNTLMKESILRSLSSYSSC